ncbi:polyamine transporter tpo5 [Friedmanniomyces endolithicus]|uniref:Polyamine transporter tpo5 n=1 Tax=Friedmanniomyces endolithicus TaxID=329885 RepID=A0AAN6FH64_9PEZI|nr:polyamine transporter tpo5 [Friedmanniomyces endolithicus]
MADQLAPAEVRRRKGSVGAVEIQGPNGVVKTVNLEGLDDADQALAAEFGYKPVFKREFGYLSTFSFAVSISGLFSTVATTFSYPLYAGGSASAVWCWLISGLGLLRFRACFGIPYLWRPVGLPYYTISRTAPKAWVPSVSWVTGWLNLLGQVAGVASSEWGAAALLLAAVSMGSDFAYTPTVGQTVGVMAGLTVITGLVNSLSTYWMEKMTKSIALLALSKQAGTNHTAKYVFTDVENTSGWTPTGWSFMFGFLSVSWTMTDYDATAHITEEIKDPAVKAPWAISMAMLFTYVAGWLFNIVLCFVMGDIASILASPMQQPVAQIFYNVLGKAGGIVFTVCAFIIIKFVTFTAMQALARTVFAFSRDRLVPFSSLWTKILPLTGTPILAVWISVFWCIAINLIGLGSYTAIAGVFNVCAIALDWSYCIPIVCKLAFGKFERGPWHLGKFSPFINAWACIWTLFVSIIFVMPTALPVTAMTMNYAIVYLGAILFFSMLYWVVRGRKFYTGPLIEAEIGEDMSQQTRSSDDDDVNRKTEKYGEIIG